MGTLLAKILALGGLSVSKLLADRLLFWFAMKAIAVFLFIVVIPLLLNNTMYDMIEIMMNFASGQAAGQVMSNNMAFAGLAAYLLEAFAVPNCLAIYIAALQLRLALKMIPLSPI